MTDTAQKANEVLQGDQPDQQIEAFPSKEAHLDAMLDKTIAAAAAEQAKLETEKPVGAETKPIEAPVATPEAKEVVEPAPEVETPVEPKVSALDRFKEAAAKESEGRAERKEIKEWEGKYATLEGEVGELRALKEQLRSDPLSFFEKHMPAETYEQLTHAYAKGEKPSPESSRFSSLEKKLDAVMGELKTTQEKTGQSQNQVWFNNYSRDIQAEINKPEYEVCREWAVEYKRVMGGEETNFVDAGLQESVDFFNMTADKDGNNGKRLTPTEVCELLKEKAQERMSKIRPETPAEVKTKLETKPAKKPAQTLTNDMESESDTHDDTIPFTGDRNEHIQKVIDRYDGKMFQGNPEK